MEAANLTQEAQAQAEWQQVTQKWEEAIALLRVVPKNDSNYDLALQKIAEYQQNLNYAQANTTKAQDTFYIAVKKATIAAKSSQQAHSVMEWQKVRSHWQKAVMLMQAVPKDHPKYTTAQQKVQEYQGYLDYVQAQIQPQPQHNPSSGFISQPVEQDHFRLAVNQATKAANLTQTAESYTDWDLIVQYWQEAITLMQAVQPSHSRYNLAQEKVFEYQRNLDYAKAKVKNLSFAGKY
jgi:hypothetical protein